MPPLMAPQPVGRILTDISLKQVIESAHQLLRILSLCVFGNYLESQPVVSAADTLLPLGQDSEPEWGRQGLTITDNVLTTYVNGVDGILAGVSTFDAMLPYVTNQLADYENDPVVVTALREASHHTLYAVAHSVAMNGVGEDTTINLTRPVVLTVLQAGYIIFGILFVVSLVLFILRRRKFMQSPEYLEFKALKAQRKQQS